MCVCSVNDTVYEAVPECNGGLTYLTVYRKRQKLRKRKALQFLRIFYEPRKAFPTNAVSNGSTFNTVETKPQKFSLHLDEIQLTAKLFSHLTFIVYCISIYPQIYS